jgi:C4-type Zn-finger protein
MSLSSKLDKLFEDELNSDCDCGGECTCEITEENVTGGGEAFNTKYAFKADEEDELDESVFKSMSKQMYLAEAKYCDYKQDESLSQRQKVNRSIKEVNGKLFRIERIIDQNIKLKTESGIDESKYWESTKINLMKIEGKMKRLAEKLRRF